MSAEKLQGPQRESAAPLSEQAKAAAARVLPLLREMEAAGSVRRSGQRRGIRWQAALIEALA